MRRSSARAAGSASICGPSGASPPRSAAPSVSAISATSAVRSGVAVAADRLGRGERAQLDPPGLEVDAREIARAWRPRRGSCAASCAGGDRATRRARSRDCRRRSRARARARAGRAAASPRARRAPTASSSAGADSSAWTASMRLRNATTGSPFGGVLGRGRAAAERVGELAPRPPTASWRSVSKRGSASAGSRVTSAAPARVGLALVARRDSERAQDRDARGDLRGLAAPARDPQRDAQTARVGRPAREHDPLVLERLGPVAGPMARAARRAPRAPRSRSGASSIARR